MLGRPYVELPERRLVYLNAILLAGLNRRRISLHFLLVATITIRLKLPDRFIWRLRIEYIPRRNEFLYRLSFDFVIKGI